MDANDTPALSLQSFLKKEKLNETNFFRWFENLRKVLEKEGKLYVLDQPVPEKPSENAPTDQRDAYTKHSKDALEVSCVMLLTMTPGLQRDLENLGPYDMALRLKEMFQPQARCERIETINALCRSRMAEGADVDAHVMKMKGYLDHLARLGYPLCLGFATDLILISLPDSFGEFVKRYLESDRDSSFDELHAMLKNEEKCLKKKLDYESVIQKGKPFKRYANGRRSRPKLEEKVHREELFSSIRERMWALFEDEEEN